MYLCFIPNLINYFSNTLSLVKIPVFVRLESSAVIIHTWARRKLRLTPMFMNSQKLQEVGN